MINFCTLYSGSSGNCVFISDQKTNILIDAGRSGKDIETTLQKIGRSAGEINAILVTHEHIDHTKGIGILSRKYKIPIYANQNTWNAMKNTVGKVDKENIRHFSTGEEFEIGNIGVKAFDIPHDAVEPVGYNFYIGSKKVTSATDIGHISENLVDNLKNSDILLIESNHDIEMVKVSSYPYFLKQRILGDHGHLSNEATGKLLCSLVEHGISKVLLGHLSRENNFPELAYRAVSNILESNGVKIGRDIKLEVALRDRESTVYAV